MAAKDIIGFLKEWTTNHIKNKDIILKKLVSIESKDSYLIATYKHKKQTFYIRPFLSNIDDILKETNNTDHFSIVVFNTKENFEFILKMWDKLANITFLSVYFVNPYAKDDKAWIIFPHTHSMVSDEASLKTGLKTMFEQVEPVDKANVEKMYS